MTSIRFLRTTVAALALAGAACSSSTPGSSTGTGGSLLGGNSGNGGTTGSGGVLGSGGSSAVGGSTSSGGLMGTGGRTSSSVGGSVSQTGGVVSQTGGASSQTGGTVNPTGGVASQSGGSTGLRTGGAGGGKVGSGGALGQGGASGVDAGAVGTGGCSMGTWPTADPSVKGAYETVIETPVGPTAGIPDDGGVPPQFTVIRPKDLAKTDLCHPLITWGNGHGDNPPTYMVLLQQLASHGFVVVASLTRNASQGTPLPQVAGIDWILKENDTSGSIYYRRIDTTHIGATGHSEGGMATTMTGSDARVKAIATLCGARANASLHGPALLLCGGSDTTATCTGMQAAFDGSPAPVMLANQLKATHGSWIGSIKDPFMIAVTGWMRLHLMGDTALKKMYYGTDCTICTDTAVWKVIGQKGMDP